MVPETELERLRTELLTERKWREELQALTIDQAVELGKLRQTLRTIAEATEQALARDVP